MQANRLETIRAQIPKLEDEAQRIEHTTKPGIAQLQAIISMERRERTFSGEPKELRSVLLVLIALVIAAASVWSIAETRDLRDTRFHNRSIER